MCRILVPWPGIKPAPPAVEVQSLNHWTVREILLDPFLKTLHAPSIHWPPVVQSGSSCALRLLDENVVFKYISHSCDFFFLSPERPLFSLVLEQSHPSLKIMSVVWTGSDKVHGGYSASWWAKVFQFIVPTLVHSPIWAQHPSCLSQWTFFFQYHRCSSGKSFYFRCCQIWIVKELFN